MFAKVIPNDVLERCTASCKTSEGTLSFGGVGHLESMNPPWQVTGGTGAYKRVRGKLVFEADIPLDPNVPLAAGRLFSVAVCRLTTSHQLRIGVVPRAAANADDTPAFVRTVYQATRDDNQLVFTSAVFGLQSCTFS